MINRLMKIIAIKCSILYLNVGEALQNTRIWERLLKDEEMLE